MFKEHYLFNKMSFIEVSLLSAVKPEYLGTPKLWLLLKGGRYSEVPLYSKCGKRDVKKVVVVDKWSLFRGVR